MRARSPGERRTNGRQPTPSFSYHEKHARTRMEKFRGLYHTRLAPGMRLDVTLMLLTSFMITAPERLAASQVAREDRRQLTSQGRLSAWDNNWDQIPDDW